MSKPVNIWFPTYIGEFFTATASMTGHEVGAYQIIIATLWKAGGSIPADDRQLAKLVKASPRQWKEIKDSIWPLFTVADGRLSHAETTTEIGKAQAMSEKKRAAAGVRWASNSNAGGMPRACKGEGEGDASGQELVSKEGVGVIPFGMGRAC